MRVGIDYRFLAYGPGLITRGMCRFTQQQLREVLLVDRRNDYVLLCNHGADLSLISPDVRNPDNVEIACYAPRPDAAIPPGIDGLLERAERYQQWIREQDLDVYHATTPFLYEEPELLRLDACPVVATFYDLIPLLFAEHYLQASDHREKYMRALGFVRNSDRLLAISDAARDDAVNHLGVPRERVDRAWPIPDAAFRRLPDHLLRKLLLVVRSRVRLPERYVLTVSHLHHSKNLTTLLEGYALLPASLRASLPLVLCCHLDPEEERHVRQLAALIGVGDDFVVTGHVTDEELCAIYNQATLVVHPSRYEGFGLPVVEAMCCGAPVITTGVSSLPEVAGEAALLVDPEQPKAFADAIAQLAGDPARCEELRRLGFEQAKLFAGQQLAEATVDCYRKALDHAAAPRAGRPRVALWTPLPPQESGISDYSVELMRGLDPLCELELFVDGGYLPGGDLLDRYRIQHFSAFARRHAQAPFDAVVYQVGGSLFHDYMAEALSDYPGIVVLHDLIWSNVLFARVHDRGEDEVFHRQLAELHGEAAMEQFKQIDLGRLWELWDFLVRHPMLDPVVDPSLEQVVLVPAAADELRATYPGTDPTFIPMGVSDPYAEQPGLSMATARLQLGLPPAAFVVGVFGIVHPVKRIDVSIRAIAELADVRNDAVLLVVGRWLEERDVDALRREAGRLGVADRVRFTGHVPKHLFDTHLVACDAVVNLRHGLHVHMSASVLRGIAAGKPNLLSDLPFWRYLPDSFCFRIPFRDDAEAAVLQQRLRELATDPALCAGMAAAARAYYEAEGTIDAMAARYFELIERVRRTAAGVRLETIGAPG